MSPSTAGCNHPNPCTVCTSVSTWHWTWAHLTRYCCCSLQVTTTWMHHSGSRLVFCLSFLTWIRLVEDSKCLSNFGNKKIQKARFLLMAVSILGKEHSEHVSLSSFSARFFSVWLRLQWIDVFFSGKQNMTWKKTYFFGKSWRLGCYSSFPPKTKSEWGGSLRYNREAVAAKDVVLVGFGTPLTGPSYT